MKKSNLNIGKGNNFIVGFVLLFSVVAVLISSCSKEDDIPPPSAYVEPEIDTTGACVFLIVTPELGNETLLDFECAGPEYTFFGEKDATLSIMAADNPSKSGINTSDKVIEVIQAPVIEPWAGFFFDLSAKIDFSVFQAIKIKVYSPGVGEMVNLKIEDQADGSISTETSVLTTVANEWEELTFNFSTGDSEKFDRFVLFFDFQGPKDAETKHYFDDVMLGDVKIVEEGPDAIPTVAAPAPTIAEDMVISLFSNAYMDVPVDTWLTDWSAGALLDTTIQDDDVKKYTDLSFAGIETVMNQIDISSMTHFHTDIWSASATELKIKIVDFGPDGMFDGGDDTEHEIIIENPSLEEWVSVDIPLADFTGLTSRGNIAQFIYSTAPGGQTTLFVDNVYFYNADGLFLAPSVPAPDPIFPQMNVISMFSDVYENVPVDTWRTDWSIADFEEVDVMGNSIYKYSNLNFVGAETVTEQIDITTMTHFHMDVWTPDAEVFRVKLVDFGPDGGFDGGDDTEHEIIVENPVLGEWISLDIPLVEFEGLTTKSNIAQFILSGLPTGDLTLFIDNVYFHNNMEPATEPSVPAPSPEFEAGDVISLFSDAYMNVPVDTWRTDWSIADFEEIEIEGNKIFKYSNLNFVGAETVANQIDITEMTHFHVDIWTPDAEVYRIKLVDFGPDGGFDGGDDTEHEIIYESPALGQWISYDIPLSEFENLTTKEHISQFIFSGLPTGNLTLFVDNVFFHK